jgi:hypothetical protein
MVDASSRKDNVILTLHILVVLSSTATPTNKACVYTIDESKGGVPRNRGGTMTFTMATHAVGSGNVVCERQAGVMAGDSTYLFIRVCQI